ncbi:hypothetical protein TRM7557_03222 [Tritonibacter multivorans]|uniref:Uncharacterized protein n=1 Tax=Tritonibacter multivorans TaxID=928856 RepID=A0A0P1GHC9_9RHOB|nr:hypothetical protein TRM7557_03222 [Tritonibacter multivorans]SFC27481.1 hypothetical protein SAMN04488049_10258 [Tritonibacter multivorans]
MGCADFWPFAQFGIDWRELAGALLSKVVNPNNFTTRFDREAESGFCSVYAR